MIDMKEAAMKFRDWFARKTYGCYGVDELSNTLNRGGLILVLLSFIPIFRWTYALGGVMILWALFRTFSKNHYKRSAERTKYVAMVGKVKGEVSARKRMWAERKTHRYFKCPKCKAYNRVPKGKGMLQITCPKCRESFQRRS